MAIMHDFFYHGLVGRARGPLDPIVCQLSPVFRSLHSVMVTSVTGLDQLSVSITNLGSHCSQLVDEVPTPVDFLLKLQRRPP